ncbi:hypothetical protein P691DRAFT_805649 [Macrolepiota fuliginosa MF-IS2]|uniref:MARVEL domain-containing protein n=1 Tax=Macrolepiota fuliginosa MF-IS2 TaxID=1400762 RepID=A0A9P6C571_9AGAR|nr:hypothetical protein P691DRAFT_805649 [Macrolepiota fuliginosa MF-IS2]
MQLKRTPFYILALFTAGLQSLFGFFASFIDGRSSLLYVFGKVAGSLSIVTWVWIGLLLRFNNKSLSTHALTRSLAHFTSFVILSLIWLAIGIMLATQAVHECSTKTLWCTAASFSTALAFLTSTFSEIAALLIWLGSKRTGAGLSVNVAQINCRMLDYDA